MSVEKIRVWSHAALKSALDPLSGFVPANDAFILISNPEGFPGKLMEDSSQVLNTAFWDNEDFGSFGVTKAKEIINFIDAVNLKEDVHLNIQCPLGVSRSGTVASFACEYLNLDRQRFRALNPQIVPNIHVLKILRKVVGWTV